MIMNIPASTILPLRAFLGLTFVYAAVQKVADPGFMRSGSSTYIGAQAGAFSRNSPISSIIYWLIVPHPTLAGFATIAVEWSIGVLVLLGLFTRVAASAGAFVNFGLFLTASWPVYPYFLGSDIVFVMCWLTLLLAGPGPLSLDEIFGRGGARGETGGLGYVITRPAGGMLSRRQTVLGGLAALVLVGLGLLPRSRASSRAPAAGKTPAPSPAQTSSGFQPPAEAQQVGELNQIPVNSALSLTDPRSGDPAVIVRVSDAQLYAYDALCTHAQCTVAYDSQLRLLTCPCHGAEYDPARGAQVVTGPATSPLQRLEMKVGPDGKIYLV
jgi:thiosulfate dehydrogenase (quinone) large subunit